MVTTELAARMCPVCGSDCAVYKSWVTQSGVIVRRRKCPECGIKFQTEERFARYVPKNKKNKL